MDQAPQNHEDGGNKVNNTFACRQGGSSSTRWTPTSEQIRILKDLYYNNGVRSPTAEQIQRISAKLRQYGKIEGKNVFYWFQNHKARERQKKRFSTAPTPTPTPAAHDHIPMSMMTSPPLPPPPAALRKYYQDHPFSHNLAAATGFPSSSTSSPGVMNVGHVGYGSVAMEKSFRDCSISPSGDGSGSRSGQNLVWVGVDPYSSSSGGGGYYPFLEKRKYVDYETLEDEQEDEEIETLPLFPIQSDPTFKQQSNFYNGCQYGPRAEDNSSRASLELTLNTYSSRLLNSP